MKYSKKLQSIISASVVLILILFLFLSTASAASLKVTETQITTSPLNSTNPVIYGDNIVWQDDRNGNWDIYTFNISTKEQIHTTNTSDQTNPAIYSNKVVWQDERNGGSDIYLQDLSTKKQTRVTTSGKAYNPRIYDNIIVWMDGRNGGSLYGIERVGNWDIYMYDISTSKEYRITTNNSMQVDPDIYKDTIVWHDYRNIEDDPYEHVQIYMYNLSTSVETPVEYGEGHYFVLSPPRIYGDIIVWMAEGVGTNYNIYIYNLATSNMSMIGYPPSAGADSEAAIYGNRIVWTLGDMGPSNIDIYMYEISTSAWTRITTNEARQYEPAIYGDRIVWKDERNSKNYETNYDIYMATLSKSEPTPEPPVANFSATLLSGKAPLKVKFTSTSTGSPTEWKWNFGDGSDLVNEQNPVHTYSKAGVYTVKHTAINAYGRDTEIKTNYITVKAAPVKAPVAAFSASTTSGKAPLKVQFTDRSTNSPTSWKWSFGDGTYSTSKNPSHTYSKAGRYTVYLTVKNANGSNTKIISGYITVKNK